MSDAAAVQQKPDGIFSHLWPVLFCIPILIGTVLLFDRRAPVVYKSMALDFEAGAPGDVLSIEVEADWRRLCEGTSTYLYTDASGATKIDATGIVNPPETTGPRKYTVTRIVPVLKPGPATYEGVLRMGCNPVQRLLWPITVRTGTIGFLVKPAPLSRGSGTWLPHMPKLADH